MLVRDHHRGETAWINANRFQALECFPAGDARIHEYARLRTFNDGAVPTAAASQHRNRHTHVRSIPSSTVETGVTFRLSRTFEHGARAIIAGSRDGTVRESLCE